MAIELRDLVCAKTWFTELSDKGSGNINNLENLQTVSVHVHVEYTEVRRTSDTRYMCMR